MLDGRFTSNNRDKVAVIDAFAILPQESAPMSFDSLDLDRGLCDHALLMGSIQREIWLDWLVGLPFWASFPSSLCAVLARHKA